MRKILEDPKTLLVDVRSSWEFEEDHLPNAKNVPLEEVAFRIAEFKNINGAIVLYCRSGNRSGMAVRLLIQAGLKNIYNGGAIHDLKNIILN